MRNRYLRVAVALVFLVPFLTISTAVEAQTVAGTLQGTVTDASGGPLPGATVTVRNRDTGQERRVVTNSRGAYTAPLLQIGTYRVTAALAGFGTVARDRVEVSLNSTATANFSLTQRVTADIEVVAETQQINTVNAEIKGSLTAEQIQDKPSLSQGSFLSLAETFTGFQENPASGQNNPTLSSGSSINFNGTGTRGATFQINGVNNDDSSENQNRQGVSLATIKEFQVLTNSYSAEFGRGYGAVVLVQTKSGTNTVNGELFGYFQNGEWNEKSYFSQTSPKPKNHRNEWGFVAGFPILQNKLFGFVSLDHIDYARAAELRARPLPRPGGAGAAAPDPRERHAPRTGPGSRGSSDATRRARSRTIPAQQPDLRDAPADRLARRGLLGASRLRAGLRAPLLGALPVHAEHPRDRGHHPGRERAPEPQAGEPRPHLDAGLRRRLLGRVPIRPRLPVDERRHRRRERHADRPLHRIAGLGDDHG